jgi:hypothetical protein
MESVFFLDVKADKGRIGDDNPFIIKVRQLALRSAAVPRRFSSQGRPANFNSNIAFITKGFPSGRPK